MRWGPNRRRKGSETVLVEHVLRYRAHLLRNYHPVWYVYILYIYISIITGCDIYIHPIYGTLLFVTHLRHGIGSRSEATHFLKVGVLGEMWNLYTAVD